MQFFSVADGYELSYVNQSTNRQRPYELKFCSDGDATAPRKMIYAGGIVASLLAGKLDYDDIALTSVAHGLRCLLL